MAHFCYSFRVCSGIVVLGESIDVLFQAHALCDFVGFSLGSWGLRIRDKGA